MKYIFTLIFFLFIVTPLFACEHGCFKTIEINEKYIDIDCCISNLVDVLNKIGYKTTSSCCGHGKTDGYILCENILIILSKEKDKKEVYTRYMRDFDIISRDNDIISERLGKKYRR
jgi:hypothetical protein